MEVVYRNSAGLDVHKRSVAVCARWVDEAGAAREDLKTFGTMTPDLLALSDWLGERGVTHVAMESTGVYWKPVYNLLEARFKILLVNARHIKQVPGRKTDVKDCQWIAQLLQHGLLRGSFVPDRPQRDLRDLTRHRAQLVAEQARVANRIQKVLEDANIKLASVATDVLGVSGRAMIRALIEGEQDGARLAALARGRLQRKRSELASALEGHFTEHHRFMLRTLWDHLQYLEHATAQLDARIEEVMRPFQAKIDRLATLPGVKTQVARILVSELGTDMRQFPSAQHLASWAGVCPGSHESAGKRQHGRTTKGNRWLRRSLVQAAWAAAHTKNTYLSAQYRQLARRRGRKRALLAVGHTILTISYHLLARSTTYTELGADHYDRLHPDRLKRYLIRRLERLGYAVTLSNDAA